MYMYILYKGTLYMCVYVYMYVTHSKPICEQNLCVYYIYPVHPLHTKKTLTAYRQNTALAQSHYVVHTCLGLSKIVPSHTTTMYMYVTLKKQPCSHNIQYDVTHTHTHTHTRRGTHLLCDAITLL